MLRVLLTTKGIDFKDPVFKDLNGLLSKILVWTDLLKMDDFNDLDLNTKIDIAYKYLAMSPFLIVIDNLETVSFHKELIDFLENIPSPSKVLLTTRESKIVGEKIINIKEMMEEEAIELLKEEAVIVNAKEIINAQPIQLKALVNKVGRIPLALSFLASLSAEKISLGKIEQELKNVSNNKIIEFCFSEIYKTLTPLVKKVFLSLIILEKPHRIEQIIKLVNTETEEEEKLVEEALKKLESVSWIFQEHFENNIVFEMLPLTQIFGKSELEKMHGLEERIREKYAKELINKKVFKEAQQQYQKLNITAGANNEQEKLAIYLTQTALVLSEGGYIKNGPLNL